MIDTLNRDDLRRTRRRKSPPLRTPADRLPPHSLDVERAVLGCVLLSPNECMPEIVTRFGTATDGCYDLRNQVILGALHEMSEQRVPIEPLSLIEWLSDRRQLQDAGGTGYISALSDAVPSASNLNYYLDQAWEKYLLRRLLHTFGTHTSRIYEFEGDVEQLLDQVEADILTINAGRGLAALRSMSDLVTANCEAIDALRRGVGLIGGVRTHLGYFDKMTGGLRRKEMAVLAGRPSTGKTSLAVTILTNIAELERIPCALFSMEMSADDIVLRILCAKAEVDFHKLRTGYPEKDDVGKLHEAAGPIANLKLFIDDTPAMGIAELRAKARRFVAQKQVQVFGVDYLQLMHGSKRDHYENRAVEVAEISGGLKALAKELNVPVLVLSQLNREMERQKNRKPQLSDLRESGAIEQDADLAALLYRPRTKSDDKNKNEDENDDAPVIPVNAHIAKQRNGPTGDVEFLFRRQWMWFEDAYDNRGTSLPTNDQLGISGVKPKK